MCVTRYILNTLFMHVAIFILLYAYVYIIYIGYILNLGNSSTVRSGKRLCSGRPGQW